MNSIKFILLVQFLYTAFVSSAATIQFPRRTDFNPNFAKYYDFKDQQDFDNYRGKLVLYIYGDAGTGQVTIRGLNDDFPIYLNYIQNNTYLIVFDAPSSNNNQFIAEISKYGVVKLKKESFIDHRAEESFQEIIDLTVPLQSPTNLVASAVPPNEIHLSYNNVFNHVATKVYRGTHPNNLAHYATVARNEINIENVYNVTSGTQYCYQLRSYNQKNVSPGSEIVCATASSNTQIEYKDKYTLPKYVGPPGSTRFASQHEYLNYEDEFVLYIYGDGNRVGNIRETLVRINGVNEHKPLLLRFSPDQNDNDGSNTKYIVFKLPRSPPNKISLYVENPGVISIVKLYKKSQLENVDLNSAVLYDLTVPDETPNLTRQSINHESIRVTGTSITASTSVLNNGNGSAGSSLLGWYLSDDNTISTNDRLVGSNSVSALEVNSGVRKDISFNAASLGLSPGSYTIGYIIDYSNAVVESNESDNTFAFSSKVTIPGSPNLTRQGTSYENIHVSGTSVTVGTSVLNNGNGSAGSSLLGWYLSDDNTISTNDRLVGSNSVSALEVNSGVRKDISFNAASLGLSPGSYTIGYIIDYSNAVVESNESDNTFAFSSKVTIPGSPNLTRQGTSYENIHVSGTSVTVGTSVLNNGNGSAGSSLLGWYLSDDNTISTNDRLVGSNSVSALEVNSGVRKDISFNAASLGLSPGSYTIGYIIDYSNAVVESNESDNTFAYSTKVTIPSSPNLTRKGIGYENIHVSGTDVTVSTSIINNGNGSAGSSLLGWYLSEDNIIDVSDVRVGINGVPSIGVNRGIRKEASFDVASHGLSSGSYFIGYVIDYQNDVVESNENDNVFVFSTKVMIAGSPNLTRQSLNHESIEVSGTNVIVSTSIVNDGKERAGSSLLGWYLSDDNSISLSDIRIYIETISALDPNDASTVRFQFDAMTYGLPPDTYSIGYIIDFPNEVTESREDDNIFTFPNEVTIPNGANLTRQDGSETIITSGTIVNMATSVVNDGDAVAGSTTLAWYLSVDGLIDITDLSVGISELNTLGVNEERRVSYNFDALDLGLDPGTYSIGYIIDHLDEVSESNEFDNVFTFSRNVTIPGAPNLTSENEFINISGKNVSMRTSVINNGFGTAGSSRLGWYVSSDNFIAVTDLLVGIDVVNAIAVGHSLTQSFDFNAEDYPLDPGTYYLGYIIDYRDTVDEINENDNAFTMTEQLLIEEEACGYQFIELANGEFGDGSGEEEYTNDLNCYWELKVDEGYRIEVEFDYFDLEEGYDFLEIYDGASAGSPSVSKLTGSHIPSNIVSSGNHLFFHFTTDQSIVKNGWHVFFKKVEACTSTVTDWNAEICDGETYVFGNQTLNSSGTFTESFKTVTGCDSTVVLNLGFYPVFLETVGTSICQGETYVLGSQEVSSSGSYSETFQSVAGCDSTVILNLELYPKYTETVDASICHSETYIFGSQVLNSSGSYTETFESTTGCDSTVVLNLNLNPVYFETVNASICDGETYALGSQEYSSSGNYTATFETVAGCDSTIVLNLNLNPVYVETVSASICEGETYILGNQELNSSGNYTETFETLAGCDSTIVLNLNLNPVYVETVSASICEGGTYILGNQELNSSGNYTETFETLAGCDSTIVLNLNLNPVYVETVNVSICDGETYALGSQEYSSSGNYTETFETLAGCDSTIVLNLNLNPVYVETVSASICEGETYILGNQELNSPGNYTETFETLAGCDSTIVLNLNLNPVYVETVSASICEGETYILGNQELNSSGNYTETFETVAGCDSTIVLNLDLNSVYFETVNVSICEGETYILGNQELNSPGNYTETFETLAGCDSTIVLNLNLNPVYVETVSASICEGETYILGNQELNSSGNYTEVLQSVVGCDSTIVLNLNLNPVYSETVSVSICEGETYVLGSKELSLSGNYTENFQSMVGCDSTVTLNLTLNPIFSEMHDATICEGESYVFGIQTLSVPGSYNEIFESISGCDSTVVLDLKINVINKNIEIIDDVLKVEESNGIYHWIDCLNNNAPISNEDKQTFHPVNTGEYAVIVTKGGCEVMSECISYQLILGLQKGITLVSKNLSPNPTDGKIRLDFGEHTFLGSYQILSLTGETLLSGQVLGTNLELTIDGPGGIYILEVFDLEGKRNIFKVIKK